MSSADLNENEHPEDAPALDADYALNPEFVRKVCDALDNGNRERVHELFLRLHAADQADLLGLVRPDERTRFVRMIGADLDAEVLSELDEDVRDDVLEVLDDQSLADAVHELDSDDAVYILEDLDESRQQEVLERVSDVDRAAVEFNLQYEEGSAGRIMQRELISVPPFWNVGQVIDLMRSDEEFPDQFFEIFVVDPAFHPLGTVSLSRILRTTRNVLIGDLMQTEQTLIPAEMDQEEIAYLFNQYHLISAAVTDENQRVIGMITVDDIVDIIRDTAEEDMLALGGVGAEGLSDTVVETTRQRFSWLFVNLLTAISASIVIALFDDVLREVIALAILMPIVASMGGNAGTQTLTVAVRALATKDLTPTNAMRIVSREVLVGGLNGILFAILMGVIGALWFGEPAIGLVLAAAMVINLLFAGLVGILVPISLDRMGVDPAIASTVFVTTVTDIVGFFVFLGLATLVLIN